MDQGQFLKATRERRRMRIDPAAQQELKGRRPNALERQGS
jgi:hypothetical protein